MTYEDLWVIGRPKLERRLRRRMSRTQAQDVADETFARLLRGNQEFSLRNMDAQAKQAERDVRWAEAKQEFLTEQVGILTGQAIPGIEEALFRADFDRAFRAMPEELREVFALTELRGLTERETADVLDVHQSTVNRRCEAARTHLKGALS